MKYLLIAFVFFIGSYSIANEYISEDEFTNRYISLIESKVLSAKKISSLDIEYEKISGIKISSNLNNAYLQYRKKPEDLNSILEQFSKILNEDELESKASLDKNRIFPVIKNKDYILQINLIVKEKSSKKEMPFFYKKINDLLYLVFALDTQDSMRFLNENDLITLGLKSSDLLPLSIENLKRDFAGLSVKGDPSGLSMLVADGNYEASFFLVDSLWSKKIFPVKGDIVVYMLSRNTVLITGSEDLEGLKRISEIISDSTNNFAYPITNTGFIRESGGWKIYNPE